MSEQLLAALPASIRAAAPSIAPIAAGMSGAGVYRVEAGGRAYVLKIAAAGADEGAWAMHVELQRRAAAAGVAPAVIHADAARRAVTSEMIADRGFMPQLMAPPTRAVAIAALGATLRALHATPLPDGAIARPDLPAFVRRFLAAAGAAIPAWARDACARVLAEVPPPADHPPVFSHNDANPTNLAWDGARLVLLDWDTAGANDRYYDLASIALFARFDDATVLALLAAYGAPADEVPAGLRYHRRLVAALCGAIFLHIAAGRGHAGDPTATREATRDLAAAYAAMRAGELDPSTPAGQWTLGLALLSTLCSPP